MRIPSPAPTSLFISLAIALILRAEHATGSDPIEFQRDIAPIFAAHCSDCHSKENSEGGLRLDSKQFAFAPNDSGKRAIVPGNTERSELFRRLTTSDTDLRMPLDADPLTQSEIALIEEWIEQDAIWTATTDIPKHWAYVPPIRPEIPQPNTDWGRNEIDSFVEAQLARRHLTPSTMAEPTRLIRRLHFDLVGLPPPPAVVATFAANPTEVAYRTIVNELLASPRYGEKWARRWLDLARYSDSNGYQADQLRDLWAYRDWVIRAMNDDMPFDQFTIEQIAGDLLSDANLSQRIATGFHRTPTCNVEAGVDPEANRTDQVIDRVNTTGTVWLGTTLECAQCHNHKYDPITQREYYQLFAFFNNTPLEVTQADNPNGVQFDFYGPKLELPQPERESKLRALLTEKIDGAKRDVAKAKQEVRPLLEQWERNLASSDKENLPKNVRHAIRKPTAERSQIEQDLILNSFYKQQAKVKAVEATLKRLTAEYESLSPDSTLVMVEMPQSRETNIFLRGEFLNTGELVNADVPSILHQLDIPQPNRLDLAHWLVSRDNPVVARVTVNRWWHELFGRGLVSTIEDFGTQGTLPSHPKLLDWLAVEFMENDWSMKHIHRLIVTSATYRQTARVASSHRDADPVNEWLSYGPRNRMPAEMIRDNALAVGGLLVNQLGGEPIYPPQPAGLWHQTGRNEPVYNASSNGNRFRRGIYVIWRRAAPYPSFVNFDAPDRMTCVVERPETNTPLQALTLLNDQAYVETAQAFAHDIVANPNLNSDNERIQYAFRKCLSRPATSQEQDVLLAELHTARTELPGRSTIDEVASELSFDLPSDLDRDEWWAWFSVANVMLNLDETIVK